MVQKFHCTCVYNRVLYMYIEGAKLLEKESQWRRRVIKEALWSQKLHSSNTVKHSLGSCWRF